MLSSPLAAASLFLVALFAAPLAGCGKTVDKSEMDAAAAYAKSVCACAEKSVPKEARDCFSALGSQPRLKHVPTDYSRDSLKAFDDITAIGDRCLDNIGRMPK